MTKKKKKRHCATSKFFFFHSVFPLRFPSLYPCKRDEEAIRDGGENAGYTIKNTYVAQCPPSIKRSAPVMKELASERRNTTGPVGKRRDEGGEAISANRAPATCNT